MSVATPLRVPRRSGGGAAPAPVPTSPREQRAPLRVVVPRPSVAARVPFAILVGLILVGGLVGLLMLHTLAAQDAFTLHDLQHRSAALSDTEQELALADQHNQAPSTLAARARALGLVPAGSLRIQRRADGRVVAVSSAAPKAAAPKATATPAAKATPSAGAAKAKPSTGAAKPKPSKKAAGAKAKPNPHRTSTSG